MRVLEALERHRRVSATGAPVIHELRYGVLRLLPGRRRAQLLRWIDDFEARIDTLPYDVAAATWHAEERARLSASGAPPPLVDSQIAAIAATNRLTLVTRNTKDFKRFRGLKVENWWR